MLPRLVGWGRAVELSMLAERLPAEKAEEWGLVNRLYDDNEALMEGALAVARQLANGPRSLTLIRKAYWSTWQNAFEQQLDLEAQLQNEAGLEQGLCGRRVGVPRKTGREVQRGIELETAVEAALGAQYFQMSLHGPGQGVQIVAALQGGDDASAGVGLGARRTMSSVTQVKSASSSSRPARGSCR